MRSLGTLLLSWIVSSLVAGTLQVQLGIWFHADMEFILPLMFLALVGIVATVAFGIALTRTRRTVDRTGIGLFAAIDMLCGALLVMSLVEGSLDRDVGLLLASWLPPTLAVGIQWAIVRRRAVVS